MNRNLLVFLSSWLLAISAATAQQPKPTAASAPAPPTLALKVTTDRADALYHAGDTVTFTIEAKQPDGKPANDDATAVCVLSKDGVNPQLPQKIKLINGKGTITGTLNEPGFLLLRASIDKTSASAGAGFDPLNIKPSMPVPDDFDSFWAAQKAALAKVPVKSQLTPVVTNPVKDTEAFDVQVECVGAPVSGYFGRPLGAKPKSLPAILFVHGAGVRSSSLGSVAWSVREGGMLSLDINAHGIPNGKPASFYTDQANGPLKDYRFVGRDDREKNYFKGMFLRVIRAIDFLTSQPEWDGKTMIVYGSSQGGFQAFAAAGLDERVTFICAGVPAGCDHSGVVVNRVNGWPKLVPNNADGKPDAAALHTARYFDNVNFATRAKCKGAAVTVGFIDTTCPPTGVYAAYNALTIPKKIHADVLAGHTNTPAAMQFMTDAALAHVRAMRQ